MIARIRTSLKEKDQGFTLIELLVVMIIIGVLAAIAVPVFLNQRKKAVDTSAKSDVSIIGKEVATYYVDGTADPVLAVASSRYTIGGADIAKQSSGSGTPALSWSAVTHSSSNWCVTLPVTGGTTGNVYYSAANGLSTTSC